MHNRTITYERKKKYAENRKIDDGVANTCKKKNVFPIRVVLF